MELSISNCRECPFANNDNEFGCNACNLSFGPELKEWEQLPEDKVHDLCPLKIEPVTVKIEK